MAFSDFRIIDIENALEEAAQTEEPSEKLKALESAVRAVLSYIKERKREEEATARRLQQNLGSAIF